MGWSEIQDFQKKYPVGSSYDRHVHQLYFRVTGSKVLIRMTPLSLRDISPLRGENSRILIRFLIFSPCQGGVPEEPAPLRRGRGGQRKNSDRHYILFLHSHHLINFCIVRVGHLLNNINGFLFKIFR